MASIGNSLLSRVCGQLDQSRDEIISLQQALTAIPALGPDNDGDGEEEKAAFIVDYVTQQLGCTNIETFHAPDSRVPSGGRPNVVAIFEGEETDRTLWIMSHLDVVPAGELSKWNSDPWQIRVDGDKIFGRGTEDNQQGIVSSLVMAKAFADEKIKPACNLGLIFVADEETGSKYGIQYLLQAHRDLFTDNDLIIIPDAGNADGTLLEVAEKSIIWFKFEVLGKSTHGSTPELGVNAFRAAANLVVKLDKLYEHFDAANLVFDPPVSTFEPTRRDANVPNINTVPGEDVFYMDCRILPEYSLSSIRSQVERICREIEKQQRVTIRISIEQEQQAAPPTPVNAPVVKALQAALVDLQQKETQPMGIGGGTVAAFFRAADMHAVVWATQDETLHEPNEYVRISNIINDAKIFTHVALQK